MKPSAKEDKKPSAKEHKKPSVKGIIKSVHANEKSNFILKDDLLLMLESHCVHERRSTTDCKDGGEGEPLCAKAKECKWS